MRERERERERGLAGPLQHGQGQFNLSLLPPPLSPPLSFSLVQIQKSSLTDFARQSSGRLTCHSFIREIRRERERERVEPAYL